MLETLCYYDIYLNFVFLIVLFFCNQYCHSKINGESNKIGFS